MKNKIFEKADTFKHTATADITSDDVIVLNSTTARIAIASKDAVAGETLNVDSRGVFELAKGTASDVFAFGETFKISGNTVVKAAGTGIPDVVVANGYVASDDDADGNTTVLVKLNS